MLLVAERFITTGISCKSSLNSQISYRNNISQFEKFLNSRNKITQDGTVTNQDILDYIEHLNKNCKYKKNTIYSKIAAISSYFKWLKKENILTHIPKMKMPDRDFHPERKKLNDDDVNAVIQSMSGDSLKVKRNLAIFLLIVRCGIKITEIVNIDVKDVDFKNAKISIKNQKRSFQAASIQMKAYADAKFKGGFHWNKFGKEHEHFFLNKDMERPGSRNLRRQIMSHVLKIGSYNTRDVRYTYLQNALDEGIRSITSQFSSEELDYGIII